jgi:PelA/Pel-15E family pectate lyase
VRRSLARNFALIVCALALGACSAIQAASIGGYIQKSDDWFRSAEGRLITANVLSWQSAAGSWPKNLDTTVPHRDEALKGTFDNGATTGELRYLARAFTATNDGNVKAAFLKGVDHILHAQYPNGGWPQFYPPGDGYHRYITFNDQTMVRLMELVRDVGARTEFGFVDAERREACAQAFDRGVKCILATQVRVNGVLTVWCAQHDERTLEPRPARTFELASLSGAESVGILELLMSIEHPSSAILAAVDAGVNWFEAVKIKGIRETRVDGDKRIVVDPDAPALWARFYELGTNRPIFAGRDGVKRYSIAEIEPERRNGYAWYGKWAQNLPLKHKAWKERLTSSSGARE